MQTTGYLTPGTIATLNSVSFNEQHTLSPLLPYYTDYVYSHKYFVREVHLSGFFG